MWMHHGGAAGCAAAGPADEAGVPKRRRRCMAMLHWAGGSIPRGRRRRTLYLHRTIAWPVHRGRRGFAAAGYAALRLAMGARAWVSSRRCRRPAGCWRAGAARLVRPYKRAVAGYGARAGGVRTHGIQCRMAMHGRLCVHSVQARDQGFAIAAGQHRSSETVPHERRRLAHGGSGSTPDVRRGRNARRNIVRRQRSMRGIGGAHRSPSGSGQNAAPAATAAADERAVACSAGAAAGGAAGVRRAAAMGRVDVAGVSVAAVPPCVACHHTLQVLRHSNCRPDCRPSQQRLAAGAHGRGRHARGLRSGRHAACSSACCNTCRRAPAQGRRAGVGVQRSLPVRTDAAVKR